MTYYGQFRLSITRALGDQLAEGLTKLAPATLGLTNLDALERRPGVYQLYEDDFLVYVGKADSSLPQRLRQHHIKLGGRLNVGAMGFACLYVDEDLHAVAPERLLIQRYKSEGLAAWNFNGFGSNDPGRNRDETIFEPKHFDSIHPADLDFRCEGIEAGRYKADELLSLLKKVLPYVFRYQGAAFHSDVRVDVPESALTADEIFSLLADAITVAGPAWQITALPGYVIMYPKYGPYPSARRTYPI